MKTHLKKKIGKTMLALALALSVGVGSEAAFTPHKAEAAVSKASQIIATGKKYLGVRYQFGAPTGSTRSFDCSSFTQYVYKKHGIKLPRSSRDQAKSGRYVSRSNLKPGDLIFSDTNRDGRINHVSIYIGNNKLLHTYRVGVGVTISKFSGSIWSKTYKTARRVI
ncbi:C40 family peptidase [Paenibacillus gansuensis]|uniref:C40 family peptidase n=1 Tax=Paenibacillus gansuensis TaxID=306542 RepID=A0ABW5PHM2_9BACL